MIIPKLEGALLTKAHGAETDYVIVPDLEGWRPVTSEDARTLCNRRTGVGAAGVIRILLAEQAAEGRALAKADPEAEFYLECFDATGAAVPASADALRVAAHYLAVQGILMLARQGQAKLAHQGGIATVRWDVPGYSVDMGEGFGASAEAVLAFEVALIGLPGYAYTGSDSPR